MRHGDAKEGAFMPHKLFEVHVGPMWSSKSAAAVAIGGKYQVFGGTISVFQHRKAYEAQQKVFEAQHGAVMADADGVKVERSRTGAFLPGVDTILLNDGEEERIRSIGLTTDLTIVDEGHFLSPAVAPILHQIYIAGHSVVYSGLDFDWRSTPFETTTRMMLLPEALVERHRAICSVCKNEEATRTQKVKNGIPVAFDDVSIEAGDKELYRPVCYTCNLTTYIAAGMTDMILSALARVV